MRGGMEWKVRKLKSRGDKETHFIHNLLQLARFSSFYGTFQGSELTF